MVRYAGLDITVWSSDTKRSLATWPAKAEVLRWALFEAAKSSARRTAPDHAYYRQVKDRLSANRATLSTARKLARHARHVLVELGEEALAPVCGDQLPPLLAVAARRPPEVLGVYAVPTAQQMGRGRLPQGSCRHALAGRPRKTERPRTRGSPHRSSCRRAPARAPR